ncbi:MAG: hypothetical protein ACL93V_12085 [Candidatus Electrothrix sp. YB6]
MESADQRSNDHTESRTGQAFLERIPEPVYQELLETFAAAYGFINGKQLRMAEYFVGLHRSLADDLLSFIEKVTQEIRLNRLPLPAAPEGFAPAAENLLPFERKNCFSFAYFDAALTEQGIRIIEFQAFPTHSAVSVAMNNFLYEKLALPDSPLFPNAPNAQPEDFHRLMRQIICGDAENGIVITDRNLAGQKTNFSFYVVQEALGGKADVVDAKEIFERNGRLFYTHPDRGMQQVQRLYNRIVPTEAMVEDNYPADPEALPFRFDSRYRDLTFVNHPCKYLEISKGLLPYITDPLNPPCYELEETADHFFSGAWTCSDFVWKDKWGYAGHTNVLLPDLQLLEQLSKDNMLSRYIAQQKIPFEVFRTGDGLEKIVELRFMVVQSEDTQLITPMARIGHVHRTPGCGPVYKVHFGDNNMPGYGFCSVLGMKI